MVQLSHLYMTTGKTVALTIRTLLAKGYLCFLFVCLFCFFIYLLFNIMSRFVIVFLPRSKHLLISRLQSLSAVILEPTKIKFVTAFTFPLLFAMKLLVPDSIILVSLMLCFKSTCSLSSFTLIKRFFSSSLLSSIIVVSAVYLRLLIFLPVFSSCSK